MIDQMKTCTRCQQTKPLSDFYRDNRRDIYRAACKKCVYAYEGKKYGRAKRVPLSFVERRCCECHEVKPVDQFYGWTDSKCVGGMRYSTACRLCHQAKRRIGKYGITEADFQMMLFQQSGGCAICGKPQKGKIKRLNIDHDHKTGEVRGLLCKRCNTMVGYFENEPANVKKIIKYLKR